MVGKHKFNLKIDITIYVALCLSLILPVILLADDSAYESIKTRWTFNLNSGFYQKLGNDTAYDLLGIERGTCAQFGLEVNYYSGDYFGLGFSFDLYGPEGNQYMTHVDIIRIAATFKFFPTGNSLMRPWNKYRRSAAPWLGVGVGWYGFGFFHYTYGDYYEETYYTYDDVYSEAFLNTSTVGLHLSGGIIYPVSKHIHITFEVRYPFITEDFALPSVLFGIGIG